MNVLILPTAPEGILALRERYGEELNCQIVHDSAHSRKDCVQSFLLKIDEETVGYGSTWVGPSWMAKGSLFEFYVVPSHRSAIFTLFDDFLRFLKAPRIHAQTNDPFLGVVIYDYVQAIVAEHILFRDAKTTDFVSEGSIFRRTIPEDKDHIFEHHVEPVGDWLLEKEGRIVATGGVLYHYNRPYGDIFMEIDEAFRRRGFGQYLVQELKKVCYQAGSVPAARCRPANLASRLTLERAGFAPCGRLIHGNVASGFFC